VPVSSESCWVVVVSYGSAELVRHNLGPIEPADAGGVVVVDNYSSSIERAAIGGVCEDHGWLLVAMDGNPGFAAACNAGVQAAAAAGATAVVLVNPDAVVSGEVLSALAEQLAADPQALVSPLILTSDGRPYFRGSRVDLRSGRMRGRTWASPPTGMVQLHSEPPLRDWLSGACLAFGVDLWRRAGGLDESYFLYWEDVDFSQRCVAAGARLYLRADLTVLHDEGGTHGVQGARARSPLYYRYNCRNRLLYGSRHLSRRELAGWMLRTPHESWQILLRGGRRQLLHSPQPLLATCWGSAAGLAQAALTLLRPNPKPVR
jgi:N-acetylglucosaminyl-diphospho-decaprenol L-rhamnosyltransferase